MYAKFSPKVDIPRGLIHVIVHDFTSTSKLDIDISSVALLHVPRTRTVYRSRAFSVAVPTLWNGLPADITNT